MRIDADEIRRGLAPFIDTADPFAASLWTEAHQGGWTGLLAEPEQPMLREAVTIATTLAAAGSGLPLVAHLVASRLAGDVPTGLGLATGAAATGTMLEANLLPTAGADVIVLSANLDAAWTVAATDVDPRLPGEPFDTERRAQRVRIPLGAATPLDIDPVALARTGAVAALLLAADSLGAIERCVAATREHLLGREQFGRPLAMFQALQHRYADMIMMRESLGALVDAAALDPDRLAWHAFALAGVKGPWVAENAIQLHGAMGFTWEAGLHGALRRVLTTRDHLGGPTTAELRCFDTARSSPDTGVVDTALGIAAIHINAS